MNKLVAAIAVAALLAGAAVVVPGLTAKVEASPNVGVKGDRLDYHPTGTACSQRGWPYFEADCLRNLTSPMRQVKSVRLVTTDRLADARPSPDRSLAMR
jgi:hypothetical protein